MKQIIKVGTRKSPLAIAQTNIVIDEIKKINKDITFEIIRMDTQGDKILNKPLIEFGGKGVFVSEFETALIKKEIDIAVHSAKDMPMNLPKELAIIGVPKREDPRDILVTLRGKNITEGEPFVVGTSSLRRQLQISELYPLVECKNLRGNINTRLRKLEVGEYDAIILAAAGLHRLGLKDLEVFDYKYLSVEEMIPAGGQGILAVEGRKEDPLVEIMSEINDGEAVTCLKTEREVLRLLNAGCQAPIGVFSAIERDRIQVNIMYEHHGILYKLQESSKINDYLGLAGRLVERLMIKIEQKER